MNRLALTRRPSGIHAVFAADAGGERESSGERFAEADEVGDGLGMLASKPAPGAAKARIDLIQDQEGAKLVCEPPQER